MKKIKINEQIEQSIINQLLIESFNPSAEKVLIIKDYLDKNFIQAHMDDIDSNGYPKKVGIINMVVDGQVVKSLQGDEMLMLLDDKFAKMIKDKNDRIKFLKQVLIDWYHDNINKNGLLSVNTI